MLRKNAESSTSSSVRCGAAARISWPRNQSSKASGRKWPTSMISVAWPLTTAEPSTPARSLPTWMSSRSSTMSTISSTTRPIERLPSENTSSGCAPSRLILTSSLTRTSGISWPRYCTMWRPLESSILLAIDFLQPRDQRQRHRLGLPASRRGTPAARSCLLAPARAAGLVSVCAAARPTRPSRRSPGDPVGIDDHDHRAVAENGVAGEHARCGAACVDIGLTTISSVWNTLSTTMPKVCAADLQSPR